MVRDEEKTREQLLEELRELRDRSRGREAQEPRGAEGVSSVSSRELAIRDRKEIQRRDTEMQRRRVQERLSGLFNSSTDAMGFAELGGVLLDVNDAFCRLTGYSRAELLNSTKYQDLTPEEYHEYEAGVVERILRTGEPSEYEKEYVHKDGTRVPIRLNTFVVKGDEGTPIGVAAIIKDMTERKRVKKDLDRLISETARSHRLLLALSRAAQAVHRVRKEDQILRTIGDQLIGLGLNAVICTAVEDHSHLTVAYHTYDVVLVRAVESLTGLLVSEFRYPVVPGSAYERLITAEQTVFLERVVDRIAEIFPEMKRSLIDRLAEMMGLERAIIAPLLLDGYPFGLLIVTGSDLSESDLPAITAFANQTPIAVQNVRLCEEARTRTSELEAAYRDLRVSKLLHERTFASLIDAAFIVDEDMDAILDCNHAAVEMSGYGRQELLNRPQAILYPEGTSLERFKDSLTRNVENQGYFFVSEYPMLRKNGEVYTTEHSVAPLENESGRTIGWVFVVRDITEIKEAKASLRVAREALSRKERLTVLGQLAGGVGHELRNPLGAIKNAVYYLSMVLKGADPEVREMTRIIEKEIVHCDTIIRSLLEFARPKSPCMRQVNLSRLLTETLAQRIYPKDVEISTRFRDDLPPVTADPDQLQVVFGNIINNAVQAIRGGGRLEISAASIAGGVAVVFRDNGVGIAPEHREKLFDPFFTGKERGIGLGLAVSRILVERHGGCIDVESTFGKGTTFHVNLPLLGGRSAAAEATPPEVLS